MSYRALRRLLVVFAFLALAGWSTVLALIAWSTWFPREEAAAPDRGSVIATTLASTVQVFAEREGGSRGAGSAVVLSVDEAAGRSLILTSGHLLDPQRAQTVHMLSPEDAERLELTVLAHDVEADLTLLEAPSTAVRPISLQGEALLGDRVWVVAFPWGRERTVVQGVVSQIHGPAAMEGSVRLIDASVSYGMSGGGVFDARTGALIGVVQGYRTAQVTLPGADGQRVSFPIAGETTVVATRTIVCFLLANGVEDAVPAALRAAYADRCARITDS